MDKFTSVLFFILGFTLAVIATCGYYCDNNNQCTGDNCTSCYNGICQVGQNCGGSCSVNSDCNQTSNCFNCVNGVCTNNAGYCGQVCTANDQCNQNSYCTTCVGGFCAAACGGVCTGSNQCSASVNNPCKFCQVGVCASGGCNSACAFQADCAGNGNCTFCSGGVCTSVCNGPCVLDSDCGGQFNGCGSCVNNVCVPSLCGAACVPGNDNSCAGSNDCTFCNPSANPPNTCTHGLPCGSACEVNLDCDQSSSCTICYNNVCSSITGGCGAPCVAGSDNSCTSSTCTYCNPTSGSPVCTVGLACNAACTVNFDCDQTGSCPICGSGHCLSVAAAKELGFF